jgi:hypothetical protein
MTDQYTHADGSRECRPVEPHSDSLFTEAEGPPTPKSAPSTPEQQATLDRLARQPTALLLVKAARLEAVTKYGHTDVSDSQRSMLAMPNKARDWIGDANEALRDHRMPEAQRIEVATRKYAKAAALLLSQIDRLYLESAVHNAERGHV